LLSSLKLLTNLENPYSNPFQRPYSGEEAKCRAQIVKLLRSPRIDSKEQFPPELEFLKSLWRLGTEEE
jgi:hypothetical protein